MHSSINRRRIAVRFPKFEYLQPRSISETAAMLQNKPVTKILTAKRSQKIKFIILGVEAPVYQGAKTQEYRDIPSFRNAFRRDASAYEM
jgi:hypothetical protein